MSDRLSVHGRTVCITGSSSGMGRAIAEHLGALGATVYLMGRNAEPMEESKARIEAAGGKADLATFDVADTAALQAWIQRAADETGRLDVMINNAGFGDFGTSFLGGDPDIWKGMLDVNVLALAVGTLAPREPRGRASHAWRPALRAARALVWLHLPADRRHALPRRQVHVVQGWSTLQGPAQLASAHSAPRVGSGACAAHAPAAQRTAEATPGRGAASGGCALV